MINYKFRKLSNSIIIKLSNNEIYLNMYYIRAPPKLTCFNMHTPLKEYKINRAIKWLQMLNKCEVN